MRWFWIDCFTEFVSGRSSTGEKDVSRARATAIKNVSLAEEHLHDHFPAAPLMPNSLVLEGLAQTAGMLVGDYYEFDERVVLAKVSKITYHRDAVPGETLTYRATIDAIDQDGGRSSVTSHIGDQLQAEGEIMFAFMRGETSEQPLFEPVDLPAILRTFRMYEDIGVTFDGKKLMLPEHLRQAETAVMIGT